MQAANNLAENRVPVFPDRERRHHNRWMFSSFALWVAGTIVGGLLGGGQGAGVALAAGFAGVFVMFLVVRPLVLRVRLAEGRKRRLFLKERQRALLPGLGPKE